MSSLYLHFAKNLEAYRLKLKLSREELAERAGVSVGSIQGYERDPESASGARLGTVEKLAAALGVDALELLQGSDLESIAAQILGIVKEVSEHKIDLAAVRKAILERKPKG